MKHEEIYKPTRGGTKKVKNRGKSKFSRVSGMDEPYAISIELTEAMEKTHVVNLSKFILKVSSISN